MLPALPVVTGGHRVILGNKIGSLRMEVLTALGLADLAGLDHGVQQLADGAVPLARERRKVCRAHQVVSVVEDGQDLRSLIAASHLRGGTLDTPPAGSRI